MRQYKSNLLSKKMIIVCNKRDISSEWKKQVSELSKEVNMECIGISAREGDGLSELVLRCRELLVK